MSCSILGYKKIHSLNRHTEQMLTKTSVDENEIRKVVTYKKRIFLYKKPWGTDCHRQLLNITTLIRDKKNYSCKKQVCFLENLGVYPRILFFASGLGGEKKKIFGRIYHSTFLTLTFLQLTGKAISESSITTKPRSNAIWKCCLLTNQAKTFHSDKTDV